jgi:ABC-type branched-subunit amino acid transport system permease subunit
MADDPPAPNAARRPAAIGAAGAPVVGAGRVNPWRSTLLSNGALPLLLLLTIPLGAYIEQRGFDAYHRRIIMLVGFNVILAVSLQLINGFSGQFSLGHAGFMAVGAYGAGYLALNTPVVPTAVAAPVMAGVAVLVLFLVVAVTPLYLVFAGQRSFRMLAPPAPSPARPVIGSLSVLALLLLAAGWVFLLTQIPSLWQYFRTKPEQPVTLLVRLAAGGLFAAVVGFLVGLPALRLRGDYLAIATLGFAEIIRIVIQNSRPLGAALGLTGIPKATNFAWLYGTALVTIVVCWRLAYSAKGRAIMAVREDEIAAQAVGVSPTRYKVTAFIIGAMFGGVAGSLYALHERSITPDSFGLQKSIEIVVIVTLGGLGSISGAIAAAVVLTLLPELLRPIAEYRMIIYSLLLVGMMLLRPQGLLGGRELWPKRRAPRREAVATEDRDDREEVVPA